MKPPDENSKLEEWKDWVKDHVDVHLRTVVLDAQTLLAIVSALADVRDQNERILLALDAERNRL